MEHLAIALNGRGKEYSLYLVAGTIAWALCLALGRVYYNILVHPLREFPGPLTARASNLWKVSRILTGNLPHSVKRLHDKYGPVVRIAPHELSFIESQAWKDIYGHHGSYEMAKDDELYHIFGSRIPNHIINADRAEHSMLRRQLSHGFSDRSMRAQEPTIGGYVDLLMCRLEKLANSGKTPIDMRAWLNFTTFDIIGKLGFGSDFGCLENSYYHPWVDAIANNLRETAFFRVMLQALPPGLLFMISQIGLTKGRKQTELYAKQKMQERMAKGERQDLIEGLLRKKDLLTQGKLEMNASVIVLAGSETTATLMSGAFFLLASQPDVLEKLTEEVRSSFEEEKDITLTSVNGLDYMLACLNEALRMYPPVPSGLPRVVPKGGCTIAGHWVPEDTSVAVWQLAANYSESNFTNPEQFQPNRFLGDEKFATDDLGALQPFSVGPRNCIGRNLAYAEMRLIVARILYRFDVTLDPQAKDWLKGQKAFTLWDKPKLPMYLKPAIVA